MKPYPWPIIGSRTQYLDDIAEDTASVTSYGSASSLDDSNYDSDGSETVSDMSEVSSISNGDETLLKPAHAIGASPSARERPVDVKHPALINLRQVPLLLSVTLVCIMTYGMFDSMPASTMSSCGEVANLSLYGLLNSTISEMSQLGDLAEFTLPYKYHFSHAGRNLRVQFHKIEHMDRYDSRKLLGEITPLAEAFDQSSSDVDDISSQVEKLTVIKSQLRNMSTHFAGSTEGQVTEEIGKLIAEIDGKTATILSSIQQCRQSIALLLSYEGDVGKATQEAQENAQKRGKQRLLNALTPVQYASPKDLVIPLKKADLRLTSWQKEILKPLRSSSCWVDQQAPINLAGSVGLWLVLQDFANQVGDITSSLNAAGNHAQQVSEQATKNRQALPAPPWKRSAAQKFADYYSWAAATAAEKWSWVIAAAAEKWKSIMTGPAYGEESSDHHNDEDNSYLFEHWYEGQRSRSERMTKEWRSRNAKMENEARRQREVWSRKYGFRF